MGMFFVIIFPFAIFTNFVESTYRYYKANAERK